MSNLILLHVAIQHHLIKGLFFSPLYILAFFCHRLIDYRCVGLFLGSLFCSIHLCLCLFGFFLSHNHAVLITATLYNEWVLNFIRFFFASIEMIMCFLILPFVNVVYITLIDLAIFNYPWVPGINLTRTWYMILFYILLDFNC